MEWIENKKIHTEILKPLGSLLLPKDWDENPYSGGYYIKDLIRNYATVGNSQKKINLKYRRKTMHYNMVKSIRAY